MKDLGTQIIETSRLILRKMTIEDSEDVFKNWTSDEKTCRYVSWTRHDDLYMTQKYVAYKVSRYNLNTYDWIVVLKDSNTSIGEIEVFDLSRKNSIAEIGYCYGSKYWNQGYATEALSAVLDFMLNKVELEMIYAKHYSFNMASGKVMSKSGMHYDATLKNYGYDQVTNQRVDLIYYSKEKSTHSFECSK